MSRIPRWLLLLVLLISCTLTDSTPTNAPTVEPTLVATTEPTDVPTPVVRTCSRPSFNIDAVSSSDKEYLNNLLLRLNPCVILVMDGMQYAVSLKEALPDAIVVSRKYSSREGGQCLVEDVEQQVRNFIADVERFTSRDRIILYGCSNEPSYGGNNTLQDILVQEIRFMRYAAANGVRVCSGNWGVGNFAPEHVEAGAYDEYLRTIAAGNHYLCVHEYTSGFLPFGTGQFTRQCLIEGINDTPPRNPCVQPEHWPTRDQIQPRRISIPVQAQTAEILTFGEEQMIPYWYNQTEGFTAQATVQVLPPYWHIFRVYWLFIIAQERGIDIPDVIITEGLHDHLDDINRQQPPALDILDAAFGMSYFMYDLRGAPSHCHLWRDYYYPQWTCEEALLQQWLWWDSIADEHILGVAIFAWNPRWIPFDMSTRQTQMDTRRFHNMLVNSFQ